MALKLGTLNCRGLRNNSKRKSIFRFLKQRKYDIVCLQETYILKNDIDAWQKEWRGKIFCIPGTAHSKGQIILTKNNLDISEISTKSMGDRILVLLCKHEEMNFVIINAYAPQCDREKKDFLMTLEETVNVYKEGNNVILAGDFNLVLNNKLDIISGNQHESSLVAKFNQLLCNTDTYDIWRIWHGDHKEYTWANNSAPWIARRLDYMLVNTAVVNMVSHCDIIPVANTDHKLVEIDVNIGTVERGPSYWKFNGALLKDEEYIRRVNDQIKLLKEALEDFPPQLKWDYVKAQIKDLTIGYSKMKARTRQNHMATLRNKLKEIQSKISNSSHVPDNLLQEMNDTKLALDLYALHDAKGAQTRSRVRWIEEGELNTKYFLGLEKCNAGSRVMSSLKNHEGEIFTNKDDIMKIQVDFYKDLYSQKIDFFQQRQKFDDFCKAITIPQLTDEKRNSCEGLVTSEEAAKALSLMRNDSAPGSDGLTASFYKFFWLQIKELVIDSFTAAFENGSMSISQRRAIITLIHKGKDLARNDLTNWRPISLTNTDYKILAKALALRMQNVIKHVVNEDQVGYIKGRNITTIIRTIDDIIEFMNINNKSGALVALDYRKAFDTVNKKYLIAAFEKFGFGKDFQHWIKTITSDTESSISYCGWLSEFFLVNSGIRQGCPLSPLAFILAVEILATKIRQCEDIKGVCLPYNGQNNVVKLAQYADDTTLILQGDNDIKNALDIIEKFSEFSGLNLNRNKTEAMWIGAAKDSNRIIGGIKWKLGENVMKILGIYFSNVTTASNIEGNWVGRIDKMMRLIRSWEKRNLSIIGKIQIIKTFLLSQFVYAMQALILPDEILRTINTIIFRFLWKKKFNNRRAYEKVRRDVICQDFKEGGLKMIDIHDMQVSFAVKWLQKLHSNKNATFAVIPIHYYDKLGRDLSVLQSNVKSKYFKGFEYIKASFWRKALEIWLDTNLTQKREDIEDNSIANQVLWNNEVVKYRNNVLCWKNWIDHGFIYVEDLFLDEEFLSLERAQQVMGPRGDLTFQYYALYNALGDVWRDPQAVQLYNDPVIQWCGHKIESISTELVRTTLLENRCKQPCSVAFWSRKFPGTVIDKSTFLVPIEATREVRLRMIQWKIVHNIYPTSILLCKMGIKDSSNCNHCGQREYIEHFFCNCTSLEGMWRDVNMRISDFVGEEVTLTEQQKLFGVSSGNIMELTKRKINHLILVAKLAISKYRYGDYHNLIQVFNYEMKLRRLDQL